MRKGMKEKKQIPRCQALIRKRDTYRYTGRTKSGFEMHYTKEQCPFRAVKDGRCGKHPREDFRTDCSFAREFKD